jgi:Zn-dependent M28 family amino/carboxypeptidase
MQDRKVKGVLLLLVLFFIFFLLFSYWYMMKCEGNWKGEPLEKQMKAELNEIKKGMESDIEYLQNLGPRNSENDTSYKQLRQCEEWVKKRWESQGYTVKKHSFSIKEKEYSNLEIEIKGRTLPSEIIIISAQYDTLPDSPGANNNGSGIAILFQLSQLLRKHIPDRTLRLLNFVNEEDPFFETEMMGSFQYAKRCRQRGEDIRVMVSLDALGVYKDEPGSQSLPFPFFIFYPDRGNFLAFIGNLQSRKYVKEVTKGFKKGSSFQIQAGVAPEWAKGGAWSDHSSFWKFGYPGIMVTDTGGFRSPYHTTKEDTMEKLNFEAMSRIVIGMYACAVHLTSLRE